MGRKPSEILLGPLLSFALLGQAAESRQKKVPRVSETSLQNLPKMGKIRSDTIEWYLTLFLLKNKKIYTDYKLGIIQMKNDLTASNTAPRLETEFCSLATRICEKPLGGKPTTP